VPLDKLHAGVLCPGLLSGGFRSCGGDHQSWLVDRAPYSEPRSWRVDDHGLTWLHAAPKIRFLANPDKRQPYPRSWEEQSRLFCELPAHLQDMALFAVNTGCRDAELQPGVGMGSASCRTRDFSLHHPESLGEERGRTSRCSQPHSSFSCRRQARKACKICVRLRRQTHMSHAELCLEEGKDTCGAGPGARP
jgi:hypothetical protein